MKLAYKSVLCLMSLVMTSCGYSLKEVYEQGQFNSTVFENNFYRNNDKELENASIIEERVLQKEHDFVFTSMNDPNYYYFEQNEDSRIGKHIFDKTISMSSIDKSFKYGMISKLFDGWWECGGRYELARVQIDQKGFTTVFDKQCRQNPTYFALTLQNAIGKRYADDPNERYNVKKCYCDITLYVSFYLYEDGAYKVKKVSYPLKDKKANSNDYFFFGFELGDNINISKCKAVSVNYKLNSITLDGVDYTSEYNNDSIGHALWLYEMYFANSTWH